MIYGYARVSTSRQKVERQIDNIKAMFPGAVIVTEHYTGTTLDRPVWDRLERKLTAGDTVVFDEVSRFSRDAAEGFRLYKDLFFRGVELVFLKERHIDTAVFRGALERQISIEANTGREAIDNYISGQGKLLSDLLLGLAEEQIQIAFQTAQHEVDFLHQRTREGIQKAKERYYMEEAAGKPHQKNLPGRQEGSKITTKKSAAAKETILKHSRDFGGTLADAEVITLAGISRNSFYKYKAELRRERLEEMGV